MILLSSQWLLANCHTTIYDLCTREMDSVIVSGGDVMMTMERHQSFLGVQDSSISPMAILCPSNVPCGY